MQNRESVLRIASLLHEGRQRVGRVSAKGLHVDLFDLDGARGALGVIEGWVADGVLPPSTRRVALADVTLLAPLPVPRRNLFCVGRNYHAHASELRGSVFKDNAAIVDSWPIVFTKVPDCVVGPAAAVVLPLSVSTQIDYEAELAVVIGKGGRNIARNNAMAHVFGYTIVNDVTARSLQHKHRQWVLGKGIDSFCPMGPAILTADEVPDPTKLRLTTHVNGEKRQDVLVAALIFDIPTLIECISTYITLEPGDVIATGTPVGVGIGFKPPVFLKKGDVVRVEVAGIGVLENPVA